MFDWHAVESAVDGAELSRNNLGGFKLTARLSRRTTTADRTTTLSRAPVDWELNAPRRPLSIGNIFTQARVTESSVCAESVMPLSTEQEELCRRLEMGRPEPSAATLSANKLATLMSYGIG